MLKKYMYNGAFGRCKRWVASSQEVSTLPARPIHVALCLSYLAQSTRIRSTSGRGSQCHILVHTPYTCRMATVEDITGHPIVVQVLAGTKRLLTHKLQRKS